MTGLEIVKGAETASKFKEGFAKGLSIASAEINQFFNNGVEAYLDKQYQKFAFTKTFLHRDETVEFYKVFYPVSIKNKIQEVKTDDIQEFLMNNQFIGIIGQAGSGKTMLMKHVFLTSFKSTFKIPIVVELRNLNLFEGTFIDYLYKLVSDNKLASSDHIMKRLLSSGKFIFLLDGYDEIYSDKKQRLTDEIDQFIDLYNKNNFVLSSRPGANVESFPRFSCFHVLPLNMLDIDKFIDRQIQYYEDQELIKKIKAIVHLPENRSYISFIQNPLLLSMFILTYADHPELPKLKSTFYYNVYDTLATKHDTITKKGGFQHEKKSGLQKHEIFQFLKYFSLQSLFAGQFNFDELYFNITADKVKESLKMHCDNENLLYDLLVAINIMLRDGTALTFPHKSIQEFFAVLCISSQGIEFKKKIYEEKIPSYFIKSMGGIKNFWDMLVELDKENFYKLYAIPTTKRVFSELGYDDQIDPIELSINFLQQINITHFVNRLSNGHFEFSGRTSVRSNFSLEIAYLLTGTSLTQYGITNNTDVNAKSEILNMLLKEGGLFQQKDENKNGDSLFALSYSNLTHPQLVSLLKGTRLVEEINKMFREIKQKLDSIEKELEEEIRLKISFLD